MCALIFDSLQTAAAVVIAVTAYFAYLRWGKEMIGSQVFQTLVELRLNIRIFKDTYQSSRLRLTDTVEAREGLKELQTSTHKSLGETLVKINRNVERYKAAGQVKDDFLANEIKDMTGEVNALDNAFNFFTTLEENHTKDGGLKKVCKEHGESTYDIYLKERDRAKSYLFRYSEEDDDISEKISEITSRASGIVQNEIDRFFK